MRANTLVLAAALAAAGCGGERLGRVTGTVTAGGRLVTSGTVQFIPAAGKAAVASIMPDGTYTLKIDGVACATFTAKDLAAGVNLTALPPGDSKEGNPIVAQGRAILAAVSAKEGLVGQWRGMSQRAHAKDADPKLEENLYGQLPRIEAADAKIREAATPKKRRFEVVAAAK